MAGFLGINKKVAAGGAKPVAPVKPAIKPIAKVPVVPGAKPAIKPAVAPIKTGVKPTTIKPVAIKPTVKEEEVKDQVEETVAEEAVEETVTLAPVEVEAPQVETIEATEEAVVEEVTEETKEEAAQEEIVEDIATSQEEHEDTAIPEGYTEEEWNALSPQKRGAITRKKNQEDKKRKEAVKEHKQEVAKELAASAPSYVPEPVPARTEMPYEEVLATIIISSAGNDWDKQVAELTQALKAIAIEPDMNTATMKHAMADLVTLKDTIFHEYTLSKTILEATERKIDMVKGLNAKGSSADERKLNSLRACVAYQQDGITINLYELLDVATAKFNFYNELMRQIEFKAKSLITMNGALKLEKDALGQL